MADLSGSESGRHVRPPDIWLYVIDGAQTERELVSAARDFLATWTPRDVARLPLSCRPGKISGIEDISDFAYRISREHLVFEGSVGDRLMLERLMGFFVHAGARGAQLRSTMPVADESAGTSH